MRGLDHESARRQLHAFYNRLYHEVFIVRLLTRFVGELLHDERPAALLAEKAT